MNFGTHRVGGPETNSPVYGNITHYQVMLTELILGTLAGERHNEMYLT